MIVVPEFNEQNPEGVKISGNPNCGVVATVAVQYPNLTLPPSKRHISIPIRPTAFWFWVKQERNGLLTRIIHGIL
ncbi:MAG: hypothetical protein OEX02_19605 [Cyclobacteriaceae bacterium]|nr:hypothetical protein [Cyclobacteriaceae bacterium]